MLMTNAKCHQLNTRISIYRANIKRIAATYVTHGYGLKRNKTELEKQAASLLRNDKFIFEPKDDVCLYPSFPLRFIHFVYRT